MTKGHTSSAPVDIYVRVSSVGGREHLISPDEQERSAREEAARHGLTVGKVLVDLDESGGKLDRPGLQEALRRVESGESCGVVVAWLDRLSRDSEHAHGLVRRISEAGGRIYAPDAPADWTTPEGELQAGIVFAFAQYVRKRARAGFERAKAQAIARGIHVANRAPVGYVKGDDRRLAVDERVAPFVREAFAMRAAGSGPAEIGDYLAANGVRTSQGASAWSRQAVKALLSNRVYLGELRYGTDDRFFNPAAHEPLVDLGLWLSAQSPKREARTNKTDHLLAGIARCAGCGYSTQFTQSSPGRKDVYRCIVRHAGGTCPSPARFPAAELEAMAVDAFFQQVDDIVAASEPVESDLAPLRDEVEKKERLVERWLSPETQEAVEDDAVWRAGLAERRQAVDVARRELWEAEKASAPDPRATTLARLSERWADLPVAEQRGFLSDVFDAIVLGRDPRVAVAFPAGSGPGKLPRRGFRREPTLVPIALDDLPGDAIVLGGE